MEEKKGEQAIREESLAGKNKERNGWMKESRTYEKEEQKP